MQHLSLIKNIFNIALINGFCLVKACWEWKGNSGKMPTSTDTKLENPHFIPWRIEGEEFQMMPGVRWCSAVLYPENINNILTYICIQRQGKPLTFFVSCPWGQPLFFLGCPQKTWGVHANYSMSTTDYLMSPDGQQFFHIGRPKVVKGAIGR